MSKGPWPKLGWPVLQRHSIIKSISVPESGAGVAPVLGWIADGSSRLPENVREAWQAEFAKLRSELEVSGFASQLTQWDQQNKVWHAVNELQHAVVQPWITRNRYFDVTGILLLHICHCALTGTSAQYQLVHGLIQLCKSIRPNSRYSEWSELWPYLSEEIVDDGVLAQLNKPVHLEFLTDVKRVREARLAPPRVMVTVDSLSVSQTEPAPEKHPPKPTPSTNNKLVQEANIPEDEETTRYSIKPWASVFTAKAEFATRDERLGLPTWSDLPDEHVYSICRACAPLLTLGNHQATLAAISLLSLLTGLNLEQTLQLPIQPNNEIQLDTASGHIVYESTLLIDSKYTDSSEPSSPEQFRIPLPESMTILLKEWSEYSNGSILRDIAPGKYGGKSDDDIVAQVEAFLKQHGDPNFLAWSSKWTGSGAKIYLKILKSEMLTAICSLSPQICPPSALYYFHPTSADLHEASEKVYLALGLGPAVALRRSTDSQLGWTMEAEGLKAGWSRLIDDYLSGCKFCIAITPADDTPLDQILAIFSQVARLAAAIAVFLHGGRGTKPEEMTWQSIFMHDTITHLNDKDIDEGRGSRLVPKPEQAKRLLDWFVLAQSAIATVIVQRINGSKHKEWRQLSIGLFPPDALIFNRIVLEVGAVRKYPVKSAQVLQIAKEYFGAPRNFMRHAIATTWPRVCKEESLLKVVTGHGSVSLELPGVHCPMPPVEIIRLAGVQLQEVLETWIPINSIPKTPKRPEFRFDNLGLKRLMKGYGQYRRHFTDSAQSNYLSKWHLTATKLVEYLRTALLTNATTRSEYADLVLHFLLIDLIHAEADLNAAMALPRFTAIEGGYSIAIERHGSNGLTVIPLQTPTSVIVKTAKTFEPASDEKSEAIWAEIRTWLRETLKACSWARVADETTQDTVLLAQVLATVSLYADLHLPGTGQFAYAPENNCVLFEPTSALGLLAGNQVFAAGATSTAMCQPPRAVVDDGVKAVISAVGKACKRGAATGARKSDLTIYREALSAKSIPEKDSWGGVLNRCIEHNQQLSASANGGRLEFSSTATYLATIVRALESWACTRPSEMTEEDFAYWSKQILCESLEQSKKKGAGPTDTKERPEATHARWLFKSMRALGFPIPETALIKGSRKIQPEKPGRAVYISNGHCEAALLIVKAWNARSELDQIRAELAMCLLREQPLRWGELMYLQPKNITVLGDFLLICANRHNHIKSDDSWRYLPLTVKTAQLYRNLSERISDAKTKPSHKVFLFVDESDGEVDATRARTLHDQIQSALRFVTNNNGAKVHHLRASTGSRISFDSWEKTIADWRYGISYRDELHAPAIRDAVYSVERGRRSFGHSSQQTSAYYYLYPAIFTRQASASRLLCDAAVPSKYLAAFGISPAAIKKAFQRDSTLGNEQWAYLARKMALVNVAQVATHQHAIAASIQPPTNPIAPQQKLVKYIGLRLLEGSKDLATESADLDAATATQLETLIDRIDAREIEKMRKRAGGRIHARTARGDIECFNSTYFDALWEVFGEASDDELVSLFSFLHGRGNAEDWKERLSELGSKFFCTSDFKLELIIKLSHRNPVLAAELSAYDWIELGPAARDQGIHPTGKLFLGQDSSHVVRSHQWTAGKIFVYAMQQLNSHAQRQQG